MTMCLFSISSSVNIHVRLSQPGSINVQAQIERIRQGASKVLLLRPLPEANLATDVEMLVRACIDHLHVTSLDLSVSHPPMQALHSGWK